MLEVLCDGLSCFPALGKRVELAQNWYNTFSSTPNPFLSYLFSFEFPSAFSLQLPVMFHTCLNVEGNLLLSGMSSWDLPKSSQSDGTERMLYKWEVTGFCAVFFLSDESEAIKWKIRVFQSEETLRLVWAIFAEVSRVKFLFFFLKHLKILLINAPFIFLYKECNIQKARGEWWGNWQNFSLCFLRVTMYF